MRQSWRTQEPRSKLHPRRVASVHVSHLAVLDDAIEELRVLRATIVTEFAASKALWATREAALAAFHVSVKEEFDSDIPLGAPLATATTSAPLAAEVAVSCGPAAFHKELTRSVVDPATLVPPPRATYTDGELSILAGLHSFYASVTSRFARVPPCSFAEVGLTIEVARAFVQEKMWEALYDVDADEIGADHMVPMQLHEVMQRMLIQAAEHLKASPKHEKAAEERYHDLTKGAGKGGRQNPGPY